MLVRTPGHLLHMAGTRALTLQNVKIVVYDEGDALLGPGWAAQVNGLESLFATDQRPYHLVFSSQFPSEDMVDLMEARQRGIDPAIEIDFDQADADLKYTLVEQESRQISSPIAARLETLIEHFATTRREKTLIFTKRRAEVDEIASILSRHNPPILCARARGLMSSPDREKAINDFKSCQVPVFVTTQGTCGRGFNFRGVDRLIFFRLPQKHFEYIFCLGGTEQPPCPVAVSISRRLTA